MNMTNKEKLNLLNSIEVIDSSFASGEIEYILIEDNETNRDILHRLGVTDETIEKDCNPEENTLDISTIGFEFAKYYNRKFGFR